MAACCSRAAGHRPAQPEERRPLPETVRREILTQYGVDPDRPMICQISRFDPWKDPLGVIDVYRIVKQEFPDLQLVLVGSMASDDPEGWDWYERTVRRAGEDYDIHILSNLNGVGNVEVNAFQRAAEVVIQKSRARGLRPGRVGGALEGTAGGRRATSAASRCRSCQRQDGYLVNTTASASTHALSCSATATKPIAWVDGGRSTSASNFLMTRYLRDYLADLLQLAGHDARRTAGPTPRLGLARARSRKRR